LSAEIQAGASLGVYQIEELIGRGPVADVYRARQQALDRPVALKVLHDYIASNKERLERFQREAITAASLRHPHVVTVFDTGSAEGQYYMAMELLPGVALSELSLPIAPIPAARILSQALKALVYAHGQGVAHLNLKPENILVDRSGHVTLTDFGAARSPGELKSASLLTPDAINEPTGLRTVSAAEFRSPEQARGEPGDARSDVYSVGILLWYLLGREKPYHAGSDIGAMRRQIHEPLSPQLDSVPAVIRTWIQRCAAKDPAARFSSAAEALQSLRRAVEEIAVNAGMEPAHSAEPFSALAGPAFRSPTETNSSFRRTLVQMGPPAAMASNVPAAAAPGGVTIWKPSVLPAWWLIPAWSGLMAMAMWAVVTMAMTSMHSPLILLPWMLALVMAFSARRRRAPFSPLAVSLSALSILFTLGLVFAGMGHEAFWGYSLVAITAAGIWTGLCSCAVSLSQWRRERKRRYVVLERSGPESQALPARARAALLDVMAPTARQIGMGERQLGLRAIPESRGGRLGLQVEAFDRFTGATIARARIDGDIEDAPGLAGDIARQLRAQLLKRPLPAPRGTV